MSDKLVRENPQGAAKSKPTPVVLDLETTARVEERDVPLNKFKLDDPVLELRIAAEYERAQLQSLMDSEAREGVQTNPEAFVDTDGLYVPVKGRRRLRGMVELAKENHPRFTLTTLVRTRVIIGATPQDLIVRAVSDNEVRKALNQVERIMAVKKMDDARVPIQRAAAALGVAIKTYERDRLIAQHLWAFEMVRSDYIAPTTASLLLTVAAKEKRVSELEADLMAWVNETMERIAKKERVRQLKDGKELRPAERVVKGYMTRPLIQKWITQLRQHERFDKDVPWEFGAGIDADKNTLQIAGLTVNLAKDPLEHLAKVYSKLSRVQQGLLEYLKRRHAIEASQGPQDLARQELDAPYDLAALREAGLDDLADDLEIELLDEAERRPTITSEGNATNAT